MLSSAHGYIDPIVTTLPLVTKQGGGGILGILWTHLSRGDDLSLPGGWMDVCGREYLRTFLSFLFFFQQPSNTIIEYNSYSTTTTDNLSIANTNLSAYKHDSPRNKHY